MPDAPAARAPGDPAGRPSVARRLRLRVSLVVFTAGACLMALEIAGSRVLAPHFGSSIYVWGSLIGLFLAAMSLGYVAGGRLSTRRPEQWLLNLLEGAAGLWIMLLPLWHAAFCRALAGGAEGEGLWGPRAGPLAASLVLFAAPSVLMGMASPFAVRLLARELHSVGQTAGALYALSTVGSIAGTFAAAFWAIESLSLDLTLRGVGALLVLVCAATQPWRRRSVAAQAVVIALAALSCAGEPPSALGAETPALTVTLAEKGGALLVQTLPDHEEAPVDLAQRGAVETASDFARAGLAVGDEVLALDGRELRSARDFQDLLATLAVDASYPLRIRRAGQTQTLDYRPRADRVIHEEIDSAYHRIAVVDRLWAGRRARLLQFDRYIESGVYLRDYAERRAGWACTQYTDLYHLSLLLQPRQARVLVIGGGGGIVPMAIVRRTEAEEVKTEVDVVEIDPEVLRIAARYFGFDPAHPRIHAQVGDGRRFLLARPDARWDVIFLDAFTIGGRLPWHLMTREFLALVKARLAPGGVLVSNVISALAGPQGKVFAALYKTYGAEFAARYVFPRHGAQHPRHDRPDQARPDDFTPAPGWAGELRNIFLLAQAEGPTLTRAELRARGWQRFGPDWRAWRAYDAERVRRQGRADEQAGPRELWELWAAVRAYAEGVPHVALAARDAAGRPCTPALLTAAPERFAPYGDDVPIPFAEWIDADPDLPVLTDDFAPVDTMVAEHRGGR